MNDNQINDELNEEDLDLGFEDEDLTDPPDESTDEGDIEFDYDEEGNIVIPDDSEDDNSEEEAEKDSEGADAEGNDAAENGQDENGGAEEAPSTEKPKVVEPAAAPDAKDAEIAKLRRQLAERDAQIKDTLKSLGADENEGIAGLERLAAEAAEIPVEEYRKQKAERMQREEAMRLVQKQKFDEKIRADLAAVQQAYPETKQYKSVFEFPNFAKFSRYRDLGLPPDEAYIATNSQGVMTSVAGAAQQQARNLSNTKDHLRSNVPVGSKDKSITITKKQMAEYKDLFPDMSDKEIVALHKKTMKKRG
ncbi:MAG: hypothetical protein IJX38_03775 [Clostridia bacterium]|nr:hypothetical protein [Clostridia bacterium]